MRIRRIYPGKNEESAEFEEVNESISDLTQSPSEHSNKRTINGYCIYRLYIEEPFFIQISTEDNIFGDPEFWSIPIYAGRRERGDLVFLYQDELPRTVKIVDIFIKAMEKTRSETNMFEDACKKLLYPGETLGRNLKIIKSPSNHNQGKYDYDSVKWDNEIFKRLIERVSGFLVEMTKVELETGERQFTHPDSSNDMMFGYLWCLAELGVLDRPEMERLYFNHTKRLSEMAFQVFGEDQESYTEDDNEETDEDDN